MSRLFEPDAFAIATIWGEARGEPPAGKLAVAEVIRNRTDAKYSSDGTVPGTCLRRFQFSCWLETDPNRKLMLALHSDDSMVRLCRDAWEQAVHKCTDTTCGALLYYNPKVVLPPPWVDHCERLLTIGHHVFYKPHSSQRSGGGGGGDADREAPPATPPAGPGPTG